MERLWFDSTMMDDAAVPPLAQCLASPDSRLTELWLGGNGFTDGAAAALHEHLRRRDQGTGGGSSG